MIWLLVGCIFIDDAEHAAFVAGLGGGPTGDSGESGGPLDVDEVGAAIGGGTEGALFGEAVALGTVDALGMSAFSRQDYNGPRIMGIPLADLTLGGSDWPDSVTEEGADSFGAAIRVIERSDGEARLLVGVPLQSVVSVYEPRAAGVVPASGALVGEAAGDEFGASLTTWVDDRAFVGVGAPGEPCGAAYFARWPVQDDETLDATVLFAGSGRKLVPGPCDQSPARFGAALAIGDFDGTGLPGVVVGAPGELDGAGAAYILDDLAAAPDNDGVVYAEDTARIGGELAGGGLGTAVAIGDLDGDGRAEVVLAAPGVDNSAPGAGSVYVFAGTDPVVDADATDANVVLRSESSDAAFGTSIALIVDVDGDLARLAVGAPGEDRVYVFDGEGLESDGAIQRALRIDGYGDFGTSMAVDPEAGPGILVGGPTADLGGGYDGGAVWWIVLDP